MKIYLLLGIVWTVITFFLGYYFRRFIASNDAFDIGWRNVLAIGIIIFWAIMQIAGWVVVDYSPGGTMNTLVIMSAVAIFGVDAYEKAQK